MCACTCIYIIISITIISMHNAISNTIEYQFLYIPIHTEYFILFHNGAH